MENGPKTPRLDGLDLARYLAFVGMVVVNFTIVMGAEGDAGLLALLTRALEGRAAATFVVLAGVGLALAAQRGAFSGTFWLTLRSAVFLLAVGLLNMLIFDADIIHYYAFYFLFGALLLPLGTGALITVILALNLAFFVMILTLNYDAGWNWKTYSYSGFWTVSGFVRNLFFNGWHPVIPWLGFLLFGMILGRLSLWERATQYRLIGFGALAYVAAETAAAALQPLLATIDPELPVLATTSPVPPMPLYTLAGWGAASVVIGLCLRGAGMAAKLGIVAAVTPAGRQTLTLYIAHILIGMGVLEAMGLLGGQSRAAAVLASLLFCAVATIYALIWKRFFRRGPIEALMRGVAG